MTVTVIAALGLGGVRAPLVWPGSINAAAFQGYVEKLLVPALSGGRGGLRQPLGAPVASGD